MPEYCKNFNNSFFYKAPPVVTYSGFSLFNEKIIFNTLQCDITCPDIIALASLSYLCGK